jgi:hypothetical protein
MENDSIRRGWPRPPFAIEPDAFDCAEDVYRKDPYPYRHEHCQSCKERGVDIKRLRVQDSRVGIDLLRERRYRNLPVKTQEQIREQHRAYYRRNRKKIIARVKARYLLLTRKSA